jgi:hypothetical protein
MGKRPWPLFVLVPKPKTRNQTGGQETMLERIEDSVMLMPDLNEEMTSEEEEPADRWIPVALKLMVLSCDSED